MNTPHTHSAAIVQPSTRTSLPANSFEERMAWLDAAPVTTSVDLLSAHICPEDIATAEQALQQANLRYWQHVRQSLSTSTQRIKSSQAFTPKEVLFNFLGVLKDDEMWDSLQARQDQIQKDFDQDEAQTDRLQAQIDQWEARLEKLQPLQAASSAAH
ncbi:hypothetical protein B9Z51_02735 [Limnohabitans sp. T6-5]|uniref:hypothetical protein n=1 Tax=Limnohabitans sp. T6-5 TaxID=1100724 RepID=UPI000D3B80DD|nr:hypothetical protein [Limnohabitans sp. T6-5]PUE11243.1 hypothetical protein B9Z51_02735 [Limnohabitans sp. T6-5]